MNAVAAAHAVNDFLFDFLDLRSVSAALGYHHFHFLTGVAQHVVPRRDSHCPECTHRLAMGDALELPVSDG